MKVDGSLGSLVQGVSQQAPTERRLGQHGAQVNMLSDPVRGLVRRHGSRWKAEAVTTAAEADATAFRSFDYSNGGRDFTVLYRVTGGTPVVLVYDRTNHEWLDVERPVVDALVDALQAGGVSAITAVGKYVFLAGNSIVAAGTNTDVWGDSTNQQRTVLWVRGGAYSRTYKATVTKADNTEVSFEYKTPSASYPQVLDTSGIPLWLPEAATGSGTVPAVQTANDDFAVTIVPEFGSPYWPAGSELTLSQTPSDVVTGALSNPNFQGDNVSSSLIYQGLDFIIVSGNKLKWLRDVNVGTGGPAVRAYFTYQYASGGTTSAPTYATQTDTEALYVAADGAYGRAQLTYKDWNPTSLEVRNDTQLLTNVYPALPANGNEYSWAGDTAPVVFTGALANNLKITAKYTHTKVVSNPNYTKQVTDAQNAYNSAVNAWIGSAAAAVQPEAIAVSLQAAASTAGLTGLSVVGSTLVFTGVKDITWSDGGDGTLLLGLASEAKSISDLTDAHFVGKTVKVTPDSGESFYMKATAKNPSVTSGVTEVVWVEGPGILRTITSALVYGRAIGSTFYLAGSAAAMDTLAGVTDTPAWEVSTAGDDDSAPMPYFVGKRIDFLALFQDRLLIGSDSVLRASKVADYLNLFRSTVLTAPADDPVEFTSQGSEDDVLRYGLLYRKDLVLFGDKRQYSVSGRVPLQPTSANMPVISKHEGAADARPVGAGELVFYCKRGQDAVSVHQIEPGADSESSVSYSVSTQLDDYIAGDPVEQFVVSKPPMLLVRSTGAPRSLFVFQYLDSNQGRRQDAWHRWDYPELCGRIAGCSVVREGVLVFSLRQRGGTVYAVADLQPLDGQLSKRPYLDSNRNVSELTGSLQETTVGASAAYDDSSTRFLIGAVNAAADVGQLVEDFGTDAGLVYGYVYDALWTPTNPFNRDSDGKAIRSGRLTVTSLQPVFRDSSGWLASITAHGRTDTARFNGRLIGDPENRIGRVPITDGKYPIPVGRESSEFELTIHALTWLPFNLTSVEWVGQLFKRPQRVG